MDKTLTWPFFVKLYSEFLNCKKIETFCESSRVMLYCLNSRIASWQKFVNIFLIAVGRNYSGDTLQPHTEKVQEIVYGGGQSLW